MKKSTYLVTRFNVNEDFYVEVTPYIKDEIEWLEFTLCKNQYGFKNFMFGVQKNQTPEYMWEDMIMGEIDLYIESFLEDMDVLEGASEAKLDGIDPSLAEAIEMHNEHVDKMIDLAESLMETYPNVEDTPVNKAFGDAYSGLIGNAIYLCCEANQNDVDKWCTDESWHVLIDE